MSERNVGVAWSTHEDSLLTQAVALYGESDKWKTIASCVPGRTNKACRKRWLHSLSPSVKKTAWTPEEDKRLLELYAIYHTKWAQIAREIPGRTDDACSKRYREALDPSLKKDEWTQEEDCRLTELYQRLGGRWGQIGHELQRSGLGCRNRWRLLLRKKVHPTADAPPVANMQIMSDAPGPSQWRPHPTWPEPVTVPPHSPYLRTLPHGETSGTLPSPAYDWSPYDFDSQHSSSYYNSQFESPATVDDTVSPTPAEHESPVYRPANDLILHNLHSNAPIQPVFQFSSSSLSAALSDPLPSKPLPPVNANNTTHNFVDAMPQAVARPYASPAPDGRHSSPPSREMICPINGGHAPIDIDTTFRASPASTGGSPMNSLLFSSSRTRPIVPTHVSKQGDGRILREACRVPRDLEDPFDRNSGSGSSTPLGLAALSLSPFSSPAGSASAVDLPPVSPHTPHTANSILYSPYHRSVPLPNARRHRRQSLPRLDSALPATSDRSVKPYACGYERCWPPQMSTSRSSFSTSKELSDHSKELHADAPPCDKPFRCALEGCGKSWRSINGLQYHLQISKSHFQRALSTRYSSKSSHEESAAAAAKQQSSASVRGTVASAAATAAEAKKKRTYACPHPHCFNEYRQLGGLRYHLAHGHPDDMPAQLEVVPPTLARKVEEKLRAKGPAET